MGHSRPLFSLFSSLQQLTVNMLIIKFCRCLDSHWGPLVLEATTEPSEPQSLPWKTELSNILKFLNRLRDIHNEIFCATGFREKDDPLPKIQPRESIESLNTGFGHTRNHSDGSGSSSGASPTHGAPPAGPRVVLGRETTPTPQQQQHHQMGQLNGPRRIPKEIWDRFDGKSREVRT